jgi:hypothetical protein
MGVSQEVGMRTVTFRNQNLKKYAFTHDNLILETSVGSYEDKLIQIVK